jgi:hypothetical protein
MPARYRMTSGLSIWGLLFGTPTNAGGYHRLDPLLALTNASDTAQPVRSHEGVGKSYGFADDPNAILAPRVSETVGLAARITDRSAASVQDDDGGAPAPELQKLRQGIVTASRRS